MPTDPVPPIHVLLVEDNPGDARLVREAFRDAAELHPAAPGYQVSAVQRLGEALVALDKGGIDVVLLDLALPDSEGFATFARVQAHAPDCPVIVLTRQEDDGIGARAMREGAQDYLPKSQFDPALLARSVRYARDRKQVERDRMQLARAEAERAAADAQRAALQALFDGALDAMLIADNASRYIDANVAACALLGRSREEVLRLTVRDVAPAEGADSAMEQWREFLRVGRQRGEFRLRRPDGSTRIVEFNATASIESGRHLSVLRDVTDRHAQEAERARLHALERAARAEAEASEAQLRALAETMPQIVWRTRADGYHDYFNRRWFEYTGHAREASEGREVWAESLHPDDREPSHRRWSESLRTGEPYEVAYRLRRHDGVYRWFLGRALPMRDPAGEVIRWFGTCTDIDDQKRAERSLRVLAEAGAALAAPLDATATLQSVARLVVPVVADWATVCLREGTGPLQLVAGAHVDASKEALLAAFFEGQSAPEDASYGYPKVIRTGAPELIEELNDEVREALARDARHRAILDELGASSTMTVPLTAAGRTFGALTLVAGGSRRRYGPDDLQLAEEIGRRVAVALESARLFELTRRERRRAEEANRAKDEFLSVASHELRTPLNAILGWSRLLRSGTVPEEKRDRALETIERNARVQVQLIEDILDVSRIITGKLRLEVAPVEMVQVAEAAADVVRPAADAKGVRVRMRMDPSAGVVSGDAARLQQIIWNLLANAVKFTPKGGQVDFQLHRGDSNVEIVITDDGLGIEPSFLPHVFEPFRQADATSTRSQGGLGLGLAIVKHLVELHGGQIEAHSEGRGRGATFTVRLPIAPVHCTTQAPPSDVGAPPSGRLPCPPELDGLYVLVVDDQPDARELVRSMLEECNARAVTAGSVAEAFTLLQASPPDMLVSDVGMPEEDGYTLIRRVRSLPAAEGGDVPAIALTAYSRIEDRTRALREGFTTHVSKPVEPQELLAVIAATADRRRPTRSGR